MPNLIQNFIKRWTLWIEVFSFEINVSTWNQQLLPLLLLFKSMNWRHKSCNKMYSIFFFNHLLFVSFVTLTHDKSFDHKHCEYRNECTIFLLIFCTYFFLVVFIYANWFMFIYFKEKSICPWEHDVCMSISINLDMKL